MTRRSLFQLFGLSWLTPEPVTTLAGEIMIPSDGDEAIAESVNVALRELMDNSVMYRYPPGSGKTGAACAGDYFIDVGSKSVRFHLYKRGAWEEWEMTY